MFMITDLRTKQTYILERWSTRGRKLHSTVMPACEPIGDSYIAFAKVPLWIRRAARFALLDR